MVYTNKRIQAEAEKVNSSSDIVRQNAYNAYKAVDDWYNSDKSDSGYNAIADAYKNQLAATMSEYDYGKKQAQETFKDNRRAIADAYAKQENRAGTVNEAVDAAGLKGSGFAETQKANAFRQSQVQYGAAKKSLEAAIAGYEQKAAEAKAANDMQTAELMLTKAKEGAEKERQLSEWLQQIAQTIYSQDFSERQFSYSKDQDKIANNRADAQLQLSKDQFSYSKSQDKITNSQSASAAQLERDKFAWQKSQQ